jgi:hypothetical protein
MKRNFHKTCANQSTFDGKPRQRYLELLGYKAEDLKEMVQNLSESVGELALDSDTAIINKSDADSSSSERVCLFVRLFVSGLFIER